MVSLCLRRVGDSEMMGDADGRIFCSADELDEVDDLSWQGVPPIVISKVGDPPWEATWALANGIDTPSQFRTKLLRRR